MYTEEQLRRLDGEELAAAYENAKGLLERNLSRYPYDARTALYLAQVLAAAPTASVGADQELLALALATVFERSPKRAQAWYILANLSISEANRHPAGSQGRREGEAAAKGKAVYSGGLSTARRAVQYYETVLDLPNAAYFLREVLRVDPHDEAAQADLEQIEAYERTQ